MKIKLARLFPLLWPPVVLSVLFSLASPYEEVLMARLVYLIPAVTVGLFLPLAMGFLVAAPLKAGRRLLYELESYPQNELTAQLSRFSYEREEWKRLTQRARLLTGFLSLTFLAAYLVQVQFLSPPNRLTPFFLMALILLCAVYRFYTRLLDERRDFLTLAHRFGQDEIERGYKGKVKSKQKERAPHNSAQPHLLSLPKVLKAFNKVVKWGAKQDITYQNNLSPADFLRTLGKKVPRKSKDFDRLAQFLDGYFYSSRPIKEEDIESFLRSVKIVIKKEKNR
ncbi:MAG: hypothetical protein PQJ59_18140 [Spirochaetales bacterium]|nr:hypothetical protein [Spirochaetales bacterium]